MQEHLSMMEQLVQTQQEVMAAYLVGRASTPAAGLQTRSPFFHDIVENVPGVRAVAHHRFSAERETIFHDHALGRDLSAEDPSLLGLTRSEERRVWKECRS